MASTTSNISNYTNPLTPQGATYGGYFTQLQPIAPTVDPRYQSLQDSQDALANNYSKNAATESNDQFAGTAENTRRQLASNIHGIRSSANSRGLLYSGGRIGAESAARVGAANSLDSARAGINQGIYNNETQLNQAPITTGLGMAGLNTGQATANAGYNATNMGAALQNQQLNNQIGGALGQGVGSVAGLGAAYYMNSSPSTSGPTGYLEGNPSEYYNPSVGYGSGTGASYAWE